MQPILLTGFPLGSSLGLVAALEWLGRPYRLARVDMLSEMDSDAYGRVNGRRETPVLIREDGSVLTETLAIARWIERHDPRRRVSFDPDSREAERMWQLAAYLNTGFTGAFNPYWVAMEAEDLGDGARALLKSIGSQWAIDRHDKLEAMLGDTPYLVGDRPTLADAVFVGVARWAAYHDALGSRRYPRIAALRERLEADPAVQFALAIEDGEPAAGSGAMTGLLPLPEALAAARPG